LELIGTLDDDGVLHYTEEGWTVDEAGHLVRMEENGPMWEHHYDETQRWWVGVSTESGYRATWWWVHTDPDNPDTDGDGIPDGWEYENWFHPDLAADASEDPDGDG